MKLEIDLSSRFKLLMARDPLVIDAIRKFNEYTSKTPAPDGVYEPPKELSVPLREITEKWGLRLIEFQPCNDFSFQRVTPTVLVREHLPARTYIGREFIINNLFHKQDDHFYLDIDLSIINARKDKSKVLKETWNIISKKVKKRDKGIRKKGWSPPYPKGDDPALAFIYHTSDKKFSDYLRWYDLRMDKKLSYRLLALIEKYPGKASEIFEQLKNKKVKWGIPIKGEDKIEKGIKQIYEAIHRKKFALQSVPTQIEEHSCSVHNNDCPASCINLKQWMKRFNEIMRLK